MRKYSIRALFGSSVAAAAIAMGAPMASAQGISEQLINEINAMDRAQKAATARALRDALNVPTKGRDNVSLELSGQVNRVLVYANDGKRDGVQSTDNQMSSTRMRLIGTARLNEDISSRAYLEYETQTIRGGFDQNLMAKSATNAAGAAFNMRHADIQFISRSLGTVSLGHGSNAADGTAWPDLSGTAIVSLPADVTLIAGGVRFRNKSAADSNRKNNPSGPTFRQGVDQINVTSRSNRIRYETPQLGGLLRLAASFTNGDGYQLGAFAPGSIGPFRYDLRAGFEKFPTAAPSTTTRRWVAVTALSVLHESGVSLTGTYSRTKNDGVYNSPRFGPGTTRNDADAYYLKLGYQQDWTPLGRTHLGVDYTRVEDGAADPNGRNDDVGESWGFFVVQHVNALSAEIFAKYRFAQLDRSDASAAEIAAGEASFRDIHIALIGTRLRF